MRTLFRIAYTKEAGVASVILQKILRSALKFFCINAGFQLYPIVYTFELMTLNGIMWNEAPNCWQFFDRKTFFALCFFAIWSGSYYIRAFFSIYL